jgi:lipoprotein-anchoring transpeptidase ErfK/SrfK
MNPDQEVFSKILLNARQAMQRGDRQAARRWAEQAAALAPEVEEPWLILAALSSPRASVKFLEQALKINPHSQRARKGMHWAVGRVRREQAERTNQGRNIAPASDNVAGIERTAQPGIGGLSLLNVARPAPASQPPVKRSLARYSWPFLLLILVAICVTAAWAFWPGNASPALAFLRVPRATSIFLGVLPDANKPTQTPSQTSTFTPTSTFTGTPTFTETPSPTDTPTFTQTPSPTDTPVPTDTPLPADTEFFLPTNTTEPVVNPGDAGGGGGERWIDVNLSEQMLYAYEGNTIVASFLVSTGVPQFPTVTGQFYTYIKLVSTLMAGDGYYLPDVPYTMYFYKGYGIHGTYWHNNFGHPMSHGCVNMYTPDAEWLFYWAPLGTLVNVHY